MIALQRAPSVLPARLGHTCVYVCFAESEAKKMSKGRQEPRVSENKMLCDLICTQYGPVSCRKL